MSHIKENDKLFEILSNHNPEYNEGFNDRVISKINSNSTTDNISDNDFVSIFRWVALSGVAAIILLLFTVYFTDGMFSADALVGILDYSPDEPLLATLNY